MREKGDLPLISQKSKIFASFSPERSYVGPRNDTEFRGNFPLTLFLVGGIILTDNNIKPISWHIRRQNRVC